MSRERLKKYFVDLLQIYSPYKRESSVAAYIKNTLNKLGIDFYEDDSAIHTGSDCGNIIISDGGCARIAFCVHMDTIEIYHGKEPQIVDGIVSAKDGGVIGVDDKSGVAVLLEAITCMHQNNGIPDGVHFIFTTCEEEGFLGARYVDERHFSKAYTFVADSGGLPIGYTVIKGVSQYDFCVSVLGLMSHTGNISSVNAVAIAAQIIGALKLGRFSKDTVVNVSEISCESNPNTDPECVQFNGQVLSFNDKEVNEVLEEIEHTAKRFTQENACRYEFTCTCRCKGFNLNKNTEIVAYAQEAARKACLDFSTGKTGAGSDAHIFIERGGQAIKISTGMMNVHSNEEYISIDDMEKCVQYILMLAQNNLTLS